MKKYKIKYGEHTVALPADIIRHLAEADADELKALILIAAAGDEGGMKSGVEMTLRQLLDSLKNIGVTPIGEAGEQFDPNRHEAIMHIEDPELGEDVIVEVFQRGYVYKEETVIRPAVVKTAN